MKRGSNARLREVALSGSVGIGEVVDAIFWDPRVSEA
jgi:hypothetical protein